MRSEFEKSLGHTDGFHDGYVRWNELSNQYESSDEDYCDVAEWMNGALAIYEKQQSRVNELQKQVNDLKKLNTISEDDLEQIYWEFDSERSKHGEERLRFKEALRCLLEQALKGA